MIRQVINEFVCGVTTGEIGTKVQNTLVEAIIYFAHRTGLHRVALTGGCFQNRYLTERTVSRLRDEGFTPYWHQRIPPNDGGIALGQIIGSTRFENGERANLCA
jgi:hydrogenase maturation protein HypF